MLEECAWFLFIETLSKNRVGVGRKLLACLHAALIYPCIIAGALAEDVETQPVREGINFEMGSYLTWWKMKIQDATPNVEPLQLESLLTDENPMVGKTFDLVVGGGSPMAIYGPNENGSITANQFAVGDTDVENKVVIIDGDLAQREYGGKLFNSDASKRTMEWVMHSIAHEIGHVMIGAGHPDEGTGEAPLTGVDAKVRLMCTGDKSDLHSLLLVKSEWDKAEEWLTDVVDERIRKAGNNGN